MSDVTDREKSIRSIRRKALNAANVLIAYQAICNEFSVSLADDEEIMKRLGRLHEVWAFDDSNVAETADDVEWHNITEECGKVFSLGTAKLDRALARAEANRLLTCQLELGKYGAFLSEDVGLTARLLLLRDVWSPEVYQRAEAAGFNTEGFELHLLTGDVFHQLQVAIRDGSYRRKFPVGFEIDDFWHDWGDGIIYYMPWRVVDYREVTLADGQKTMGAVLMRVNASPNKVFYRKVDLGDESKYKYKRYITQNEDFDIGRFAISDIREYLNSSAKDGYVAGCSKCLLNSVSDTTIVTSGIGDYHRWRSKKETMATKGKDFFVPADDEGSDKIICKFFLPTPEYLHMVYYGYYIGNSISRYYRTDDVVDAMAWEYFFDTLTHCYYNCEKRSFASPDGIKRTIWLNNSNEDMLNEKGRLRALEYGNDTANFVPACVVTGVKTK